MTAPAAAELKAFVFESIRSVLAAKMLWLCERYKASFVSLDAFAKRLKEDRSRVARVLIDWTRQGLVRPSATGNYYLAAPPEKARLMRRFYELWSDARGCNNLARWVRPIEAGQAASIEVLPEVPELEPAAAAAAVAPPAPPPAKKFIPQTSKEIDEKTEREIRKNVAAIPPLPLVAQQLLNEIYNPQSSAKSLANIAIKDPAITMSLLKMANSAFYAQRDEVTDVQRAIVVIGLRNVKHMVLASGIGRVFVRPKHGGYNFDALWTHALGTSVAARLLARRTQAVTEVAAGTLGLLHYIGKFAMNVMAPERTAQLLDPFEGPEGVSGLAKEVMLFGTTHAIYGMRLLEAWKLPHEVARIVEHHHHPSHAEYADLSEDILRGLSLVHVANQVTKMGGLDCGDRMIEQVPKECFEILNLPPDLDALLDERMRKTFEQVKFFVSKAARSRPAKRPSGRTPQEPPRRPGSERRHGSERR